MALDSSPSSAAPAEPHAPKAYVSPELSPLGHIAGLTAGPDGGTLDQLANGDGGFIEDDPTSP